MTPETKTKWIDALRSGEFQQGRYALYNNQSDTYCCLGVLCKVLNIPDINVNSEQGYSVLADTHKVNTFAYMTMNDQEQKSFLEIADHIEANE